MLARFQLLQVLLCKRWTCSGPGCMVPRNDSGAQTYVSEAQLSACQKPSSPTVSSWLGSTFLTAGATSAIQFCIAAKHTLVSCYHRLIETASFECFEDRCANSTVEDMLTLQGVRRTVCISKHDNTGRFLADDTTGGACHLIDCASEYKRHSTTQHSTGMLRQKVCAVSATDTEQGSACKAGSSPSPARTPDSSRWTH